MINNGSINLSLSDEDFFDAQEFVPSSSQPAEEPNLKSSIDDCFTALNLFLNNEYSQAISTLINFIHTSMYHSLGYAVLLTMKALLTFDDEDKQLALLACKRAVSLAERKKRKNNKILSLLLPSPKLSDLEEIELHAVICYAEANLVYAAIRILTGSSYHDYIRVILLVRQCYMTYKECAKVVDEGVQVRTEGVMRKHFETGTLLGHGIFNIMLSMLPERIIKMLNFVGFSGERKLGLSYIYKGTTMTEGIRSPLCATTYLFYNTYTVYFIGGQMSDIARVEHILTTFTQNYPKSAFTSLFKGRFAIIRGSPATAIDEFNQCISSQDQLQNFHHLCYWELMWCYCLQLKWGTALNYINLLLEESSWSKLIYSYHSAVLSSCHEGKVTSEAEEEMRNLKKLRAHFATKSFPMEKFFLKKGEMFIKNKRTLILPLIELMYIFGVMNMIYDNREVVDDLLRSVKNQQSLLQSSLCDLLEIPDHSVDDFMLAVFLRGVCLSRKRENVNAVNFFNQVIASCGIIKENCYLVPFALVEKGLCLLDDPREAEKCFHKALKCKNHDLESRLHYSAQCALARL